MGVLLHKEKAALADFTASFKSFEVDIGTLDNKFPSWGEITSNVFVDVLSTNFPLIKFCTG